MNVSRRPPQGVTLVEIMAAMTVLMIVAATAAALLETSIKVERAGRLHAAHEAALLRVGSMIRRDVRGSSEAIVRQEGAKLSLRGPVEGHFIDYTFRNNHLRRDEWQDLELLEHDLIELNPRIVASFEVLGEPDHRIVALLLDRTSSPTAENGDHRTMRIEASLAAEWRFEEGWR